MLRNRPGAIADAYAKSVRAFVQVWGHGQQPTVGELDAFIAPFLVKLVGFDEQAGRIQDYGFCGVEYQVDGITADDPVDKERCVSVSKIDLFADIATRLGDVVAILVAPDGAVEMVDDAFVFEAAVAIVPAAPVIHPENGIFFGNHHFGQARRHA